MINISTLTLQGYLLRDFIEDLNGIFIKEDNKLIEIETYNESHGGSFTSFSDFLDYSNSLNEMFLIDFIKFNDFKMKYANVIDYIIFKIYNKNNINIQIIIKVDIDSILNKVNDNEDLRKFYTSFETNKIKRCKHPYIDCDKIAINSHTLSKSIINRTKDSLKGEDLYCIDSLGTKNLIDDIFKDNSELEFNLKGLRDVSVFYGLCENHDGKFFNVLDSFDIFEDGCLDNYIDNLNRGESDNFYLKKEYLGKDIQRVLLNKISNLEDIIERYSYIRSDDGFRQENLKYSGFLNSWIDYRIMEFKFYEYTFKEYLNEIIDGTEIDSGGDIYGFSIVINQDIGVSTYDAKCIYDSRGNKLNIIYSLINRDGLNIFTMGCSNKDELSKFYIYCIRECLNEDALSNVSINLINYLIYTSDTILVMSGSKYNKLGKKIIENIQTDYRENKFINNSYNFVYTTIKDSFSFVDVTSLINSHDKNNDDSLEKLFTKDIPEQLESHMFEWKEDRLNKIKRTKNRKMT